jgi:DNA-binding MarR family transcriptional regulator
MRDSRIRDSIHHRVGKLFRLIAREHNRALKPLHLSAVQANILAVLWTLGPMTMGELMDEMALGSSTLTGTIDRMEKDKLVRRVAMSDRRAFRVQPAAWPERRREAVFARLARTEEECLSSLSAADRRALARLLDRAIGGIEA